MVLWSAKAASLGNPIVSIPPHTSYWHKCTNTHFLVILQSTGYQPAAQATNAERLFTDSLGAAEGRALLRGKCKDWDLGANSMKTAAYLAWRLSPFHAASVGPDSLVPPCVLESLYSLRLGLPGCFPGSHSSQCHPTNTFGQWHALGMIACVSGQCPGEAALLFTSLTLDIHHAAHESHFASDSSGCIDSVPLRLEPRGQP